MGVLILCNMIFITCFLCVQGIGHAKAGNFSDIRIRLTLKEVDEKEESAKEINAAKALGIAQRAVSGQRVLDFYVLEQEQVYSLGDADMEALLRIVESEAGNEDEDGKLLVANVVLNRVNSERFPATVTEVVFQQEKGVAQFSPISNGTFYKVEISEETYEAVNRALLGEDISEGALFFASRKYADSEKMKWFDENLTFLLKHGGHEFFK